MNKQAELFSKYIKFTELMLEDYSPLEVAAIMSVVSLGMYKTFLDDEGFEAIVDEIVKNRKSIKPFQSPGWDL